MKFEILIPTYNRPNYLKRILEYYDSFNNKFKIIVADSSIDKYKKMNGRLISSFDNLKIEYLDEYSPSLNAHHKLADMVQHVKEKYCIFCADDDFVIPSGIEESIKFLEKNLDFICAHGNYLNYKYNQKYKTFYWKKIYPYESLKSNDPRERLKKHLKNYYQVLYATHRTKQRKLIYDEVLNSNVDPMQFGEIQPDQLSIIIGKMKRIDKLYMMREAYSRVGGYWPSSEHWPSLIEYIEKNLYEKEYEKFKECLSTYLSKEADISLKEATDIVHNNWQKYLDSVYSKHRALLIVRDIGKLFESLNLQKLYNFIFKKIDKIHREVTIRSWNTKKPPPEYIDDFIKVKECVIRHSKIVK